MNRLDALKARMAAKKDRGGYKITHTIEDIERLVAVVEAANQAVRWWLGENSSDGMPSLKDALIYWQTEEQV